MFDEKLRETWRSADSGAAALSRDAIEQLLRPSGRRTSRTLASIAWTHVVMLFATAVLALSNLWVYQGNTTMLAVEGCMALAAAALAANSLRLVLRVRRTDRADRPLLETIESQLSLYERAFEPWLVLASVSPWLFSLAINTRIDASPGGYRINQPLEFVVMSAVMLVITYFGMRVALSSTVYELRAVLHDLRAEALELSPSVAAARKRSRVWLVVGVVLLSFSVLAALWLWWKMSSAGGVAPPP